jgi:hypothetical protein
MIRVISGFPSSENSPKEEQKRDAKGEQAKPK